LNKLLLGAGRGWIQNGLEWERLETVALTFVELALELHPGECKKKEFSKAAVTKELKN
jgi:hypothetical protein